jgi:predicted RNA binding protein YcfA (HicA-like mRNA interferase family)
MSKLPVVSGRECIRALQAAGFRIDRKRGSHVVLIKAGAIPVTVPLHDPLKRGTLRGIVRDAGLTVADFNRLLKM